jgi:hypothetical protein
MPLPAISNVGTHPGAVTPPSDANQWGSSPDQEDMRGNTTANPSQVKDKNKLFDILRSWFRADATHAAAWREEAKDMYDFRAGEQWKPEDRQILNAQSRPEITFNRVLTILKAVAGMEINGRHEVHYIPRHNEDTAINELLTGAGKWMTDECDAEDEESQGFEDTLTCGLGWTEHRLDYELDQQGIYVEERVDPLEMYPDRNAKRKNLVDARRMTRVRQVPLLDALQMFPGKTRAQLDATWAVGTDISETHKTLEEKRKREENTTDTTYDDMYEITLVNMQWWERETYWLVADPMTNQMQELSNDEYMQFSQHMSRRPDLKFMAVQMTKRCFKEAYLGGEILSVGDAALGQFKWTCITGEFNRTRGQFFGLVKVMQDPQMWANKWLSQSLHILNSTAKGGIVAEQDAFEDVRDAEDKWSRPDTIVWTKRGALSGDKPKIMPRPGGTFPQGHIQLMEFAISAIRDVTGINLELLGLKDANQPGILEAQRKQAGMTVLATVFDSLRRFRKLGGRIRLFVMQHYLSDGRLIRIVGPEGAKAIPLMKDKTTGDYNVIIDDAPTSPNQKESNWAIISQLLPAFKDQLMAYPQLMVMLMEYSPLPSRIVETLKTMLQQSAPQQQQQAQMAQAAQTAMTNKNQAQAELFLSQAKKTESTALYDIATAMAQFMDSHNKADLNSAKAAHERVKAAVAALTPIPDKPDPGKDQAHERAMQHSDHVAQTVQQVADNMHDQQMQVGQQRFDLLQQLLEQQHERQMAAVQAAYGAQQSAQDSQQNMNEAAQPPPMDPNQQNQPSPEGGEAS